MTDSNHRPTDYESDVIMDSPTSLTVTYILIFQWQCIELSSRAIIDFLVKKRKKAGEIFRL